MHEHFEVGQQVYVKPDNKTDYYQLLRLSGWFRQCHIGFPGGELSFVSFIAGVDPKNPSKTYVLTRGDGGELRAFSPESVSGSLKNPPIEYGGQTWNLRYIFNAPVMISDDAETSAPVSDIQTLKRLVASAESLRESIGYEDRKSVV